MVSEKQLKTGPVKQLKKWLLSALQRASSFSAWRSGGGSKQGMNESRSLTGKLYNLEKRTYSASIGVAILYDIANLLPS